MRGSSNESLLDCDLPLYGCELHRRDFWREVNGICPAIGRLSCYIGGIARASLFGPISSSDVRDVDDREGLTAETAALPEPLWPNIESLVKRGYSSNAKVICALGKTVSGCETIRGLPHSEERSPGKVCRLSKLGRRLARLGSKSRRQSCRELVQAHGIGVVCMPTSPHLVHLLVTPAYPGNDLRKSANSRICKPSRLSLGIL